MVEEPRHVRYLHAREPGDPLVVQRKWQSVPYREGLGRNPVMNDTGKSDKPVVPTKLQNKTRQAEDAVEGRGLTKGNSQQQSRFRTQSRADLSQALERVREAAKREKGQRFTALLHHVTEDRLWQAYQTMRRDAAAGTDGQTWKQYGGEGLEVRLKELHSRLHRGAYRAKPTRRVYIPKPDGRQRPLGIASLEDKIVQRAVADVLNAIYETDFLGFSYGFRPGRSQHNALDALTVALYRKKVNWVLDADIRGFFDAIDHGWLRRFVEHRVADKRILRLLQKWLRAGVMEEGVVKQTREGTPQGATISPLLANIYLHYVLDIWVQWWRRRHAAGEVIIVRYADDFVIGFQYRSDAERLHRQLRQRLNKFALELNESKTRLIEFGCFAASNRQKRGEGKPESFVFLGLRHICGKTRNGKFCLVRRSAQDKMRSTLQIVKAELYRRRHQSVPEQGLWLQRVVRGYFAYHAVPTNINALKAFRWWVIWYWHRALRRRSQRDRTTWARVTKYAERWLPRPRILHPWPSERLHVMT